MAIGTNASELLFRAKGDTDDARKKFGDLKKEIKDTTDTAEGEGASGFAKFAQSIGLSEGAVANLAAAAPIAGAAIVAMGLAVVNAAVSGAQALWDLSKSASDFGSEIFDASEKTGLSAEALSAMKFAADQSGASLEQVTGGIEKFAKTVGAAADGSKEATAALKEFGLSPQEAIGDLDAALAKVFKKILDAPPGIERMTLAQKAFGKSGADLLPFINSFNGDLDELIAKAKELGVTIDDEAARAADEFGDSLDTLGAQFSGLGRTIGFVFMPVFTDMIQSVSSFLARNQEHFQDWAERIKIAITGLQQQFAEFSDNMREYTERSGDNWQDMVRRILRMNGPLVADLDRLNEKLFGKATGAAGYSPETAREGGARSFNLSDSDVTAPKSKGARAKKDTSAQRAASAEIATEQINLKTVQDEFRKSMEELVVKGSSVREFIDGWSVGMARFNDNLDTSLRYIEERETRLLDADATEAERNLLAAKQIERRRDLEERFADFRIATIEKVKNKQKEADDAEWDRAMALARLRLDQIEEQQKRMQMFKDLQEDFKGTLTPLMLEDFLAEPMEGAEETIFDKWSGSFRDFYDSVMESGPNLSSTLNDIANMGTDAFEGFASALGSVIEAWVLTGETGPAVLKKLLAATLASIAAESAVRAVFELAKGFAALFFNPAEAAAHFQAAALFGSIAVGTGLAGRAIAGDSFKKETSGGFGSTNRSGNDEDQSPISRVSDDAFTSGRATGSPWQRVEERLQQMVDHTRETALQAQITSSIVAGTMGRFEPMTAGQVLMAGTQEEPGLIGRTLTMEAAADATIGSDFRRVTGLG